ncbi:MAG: HAMP domain-containing protein [Anaerolineae bacterium]|nr:HAMP domain-containing protein [Anaerolineae bacterium]
MFNSLRVRLTFLFVGLTIVPLVIVGSLIAQRGSDTLQNQSVEFQDQLAQQTAMELEAFFKERQSELFVLTDVYGLDSLDLNTQKDVLLTLISKQPAYYELTMANIDGQEVIKSTREEVVTGSELTNIADDPLFQAAVETGKISFSPVYFNEAARDRLITVAIPIEDLFTGTTGHVLIAEIRFQNIGEAILRNLELAEGADVYVVDHDGTVIAHRDPNLVLKETVFKLPEADGRYTGLDGSDVILATDTVRLANLELIVVAETLYSNATALASDLTRLATLITLATLVVAGIVVMWSVDRVVHPISKIARVAESIQGGDLSVRADEGGSDEIAALGRAFNKMTAQIRQTIAELEQNEARFRNIIEYLPIGMHVFHLESDGRLLFDGANPAGSDIIRYAAGDLVGKPIEEAFPALTSTELPARYYEVASEGTTWQVEEINLEDEQISGDYAVYAFQTSPGTMVSAWIDVGERKRAEAERARLQQQVIDAQARAIRDLSSPVIPILDAIIVMPLIGSIDTARARDITRALLAGITSHHAKVAILDITGVPIVDSGVAAHLDKTIQAARLKGTHTIVTGISGAVAETIVDLGIDWSGIETVRDLQTGLISALRRIGARLDA